MLSARHPDNPQRVLEILNTPHPVKLFTYDGPIERVMSSVDSLALHAALHARRIRGRRTANRRSQGLRRRHLTSTPGNTTT